jgi:RNA polymerase sigma factor (sigma-70 family)
MVVVANEERVPQDFADFVHDVEPRLRQALVSTYGPIDGREATVDALSWAWEHWDRLAGMDNRLGYLYRVGQSAIRRFTTRPLPVDPTTVPDTSHPELTPELLRSLAQLSEQQRTVVVLVHGYGWQQAEVATLLEIGPSTVHEHLNRAMTRLRADLEDHDER